jgi:hypothetical protein
MSKLAFASLGDFLGSLAKNRSEPSREVSVFLSSWWLSHYLGSWDDQRQYLQSLEPLCIFGRQLFRNRLGFQYQRIALNQSLEPRLESLTLEDNGFLNCSTALSEHLFPQVLDQLKNEPNWDELRISAINTSTANVISKWANANGLIFYEYANSETFWVDFSVLDKQVLDPFLSSRSANCRQQLRRAKRQIEEQIGVLSIESAMTTDEAKRWMLALGKLHQSRWPSQNPLEGFNNPIFIEFFRNIIDDGLLSGTVQLLKINSGTKTIGYLFNLIKEGRVSFLMSGIDYQETEKYKPGMLCHWLAIEKNLSLGMQVYDFLNGANRYKDSLSTNRAAVKTVTVAKPRLGLRLEHLIRNLQRSRRN